MGRHRASAARAGSAIGVSCESREERAAPPPLFHREPGIRCADISPPAAAILALPDRRNSMHVRSFLASISALLVLTTPVGAATPDDPGAPAPPAGYSPVTAGTKTYRPVEPLPWGDINRRVTPQPKKAPADRDKGAMPGEAGPKHKH